MSNRFAEIKQELTGFREGSLRLEDRTQRGLDPIGILVLGETGSKVLSLCNKFDVNFNDLLQMTIDIQSGGPWKYASKFKEGKDSVVKLWAILHAINNLGKEREMDLTPEEFVADVERINGFLDRAMEAPDVFFENYVRKQVFEAAEDDFRISEGVPIAELDKGFLSMAIKGYEAGILQDSDGVLFVGSKLEISDDIFSRWGLHQEIRKDRGREVPFFLNNKGEAIAKKLYPGFVIILSRNFELAKELVKSVLNKDYDLVPGGEMLGHKIYHPTSMQGKEEKTVSAYQSSSDLLREYFKNHQERDMPFEEIFYDVLFKVKSSIIYEDALDDLKLNRSQKNLPLTEDDTLKLKAKVENKVFQKIEELKYLLEVISPNLDGLPKNVNHVMDMAGGAGDLGLAVTMELLRKGLPIKKTEIVEPVSDLANFTDIIMGFLPKSEIFKEIVSHNSISLQEAKIDKDSIVVAKHPCGDLADSIIDQWIKSESPMLVIMTCCQDKAKDQPAKYQISQSEWHDWCKLSAKTNSDNAKHRAIGMAAMGSLDGARVKFLQRHGFDAQLIQTNLFPKGDVIIAKRKKI